MTETEAKRRIRPRKGCVLLELSPDDRQRLDGVREGLQRDLGVPVSLAGTLRLLVRRAAMAGETTS